MQFYSTVASPVSIIRILVNVFSGVRFPLSVITECVVMRIGGTTK